MECEYCQNEFKSRLTLKQHQKTAKYCLVKQNTQPPQFNCAFCNRCFTIRASLNKHIIICKANCPAVKERESQLKKEFKQTLSALQNSYGYLITEAPIKAKRNLQQISPEYLLSFDREFHSMVTAHIELDRLD